MSSTGMDPGNRSAAEIEREVEHTRARLTGTVEQLKDRVSPGQVAEQAMDWLRGSGGREFVNNLGATLRDNPMPVVLVAAGIGWLALSGGQRGARARDWQREGRYAGAYPGENYTGENYTGETYGSESYPAETYAGQGLRDASDRPSLTQRAGEAAGGLRDKAEDLAGRASATVGEAWERASGTARSLAEGATETGRHVSERAGQALHSAAGTASGLGHRAAEYGSDAGRRIAGAVESQPLLLGVFGFALGAALGALVPHTEAEDRLLGESRDRVADRISSLAGEAYGQARDVAGEQMNRAGEHLGEAYGRTKERLAGTGASASEGASALGEVARDLRKAVERTAQDVAGAAREAVERPEDRPEDRPGQRPEQRPAAPPTGGPSTGMPQTRSGPESGGPV